MLDFKAVKGKYRLLPQASKITLAVCLVALLISLGIVYAMKASKPQTLQCIESSQNPPPSGKPNKLLGNIEATQLKNEIMRYSRPDQPTTSHRIGQNCGYSLIGWSNSGSSQRNTFQSQTNRISPAQVDIVTGIWETYKDNTYLIAMDARFDYTSDNPKTGQKEKYQTLLIVKLNTQDPESAQSTIKDITSIASKIENNSKDYLSTQIRFINKDGDIIQG